MCAVNGTTSLCTRWEILNGMNSLRCPCTVAWWSGHGWGGSKTMLAPLVAAPAAASTNSTVVPSGPTSSKLTNCQKQWLSKTMVVKNNHCQKQWLSNTMVVKNNHCQKQSLSKSTIVKNNPSVLPFHHGRLWQIPLVARDGRRSGPSPPPCSFRVVLAARNEDQWKTVSWEIGIVVQCQTQKNEHERNCSQFDPSMHFSQFDQYSKWRTIATSTCAILSCWACCFSASADNVERNPVFWSYQHFENKSPKKRK